MTNSTPQALLQLINHQITRGGFVLCDGINLTLNTGEVCHLRGANGAGKTTLLMQLAGLFPHYNVTNDNDDGNIGEKYTNNKTAITTITNRENQPVYVSHQLGIHPNLTASQNIQFLLNLYAICPTQAEITEALSFVGLQGYEDISCNELSAGQTRRVNLARLWLITTEHSKLWLLDEPFTALDVTMVARLQDRIRDFANAGGAVLLTSHQVEGMDKLADLVLDL